MSEFIGKITLTIIKRNAVKKSSCYFMLFLMVCMLTACKEEQNVHRENNENITNDLPDSPIEDTETGLDHVGDILVGDESDRDEATPEDKPNKIEEPVYVAQYDNEYFYIENGELKYREFTPVSATLNYKGSAYSVSFSYSMACDRLVTIEDNLSFEYCFEQIKGCTDKLLFSGEINGNRVYRVFDLNTKMFFTIYPEEFENTNDILFVMVGGDRKDAVIATRSDEWYYWDGQTMTNLNQQIEQVASEANGCYVRLVEGKIVFRCTYYSETEGEPTKDSCYVYDPETGEITCTFEKISVWSWKAFEEVFLFSVNQDGYITSLNRLTGQEKVSNIKTAHNYVDVVMMGEYAFFYNSDNRFYVLNPYNGRTIAVSGEINAYNQYSYWVPVTSDKDFYIGVYGQKDIQIYKIESEE